MTEALLIRPASNQKRVSLSSVGVAPKGAANQMLGEITLVFQSINVGPYVERT